MEHHPLPPVDPSGLPAPASAGASLMTFGIYPGGRVGNARGPEDDPQKIEHALRALEGEKPFIVRGYTHYTDTPADTPAHGTGEGDDPRDIYQYLRGRRQLDLVLSYTSASGNVDGWTEFVRNAVRRHRNQLRYLQVTLEPNFPIPGIDGFFPNVRQALVEGVLAADDELQRARLKRQVKVGFSVAEPPEWLGGDGDFWLAIASLGGAAFVNAIDYVGLALYPDTFSPAAPLGEVGDVRHLVVHGLRTLREQSLPQVGIPATVPIHVAENGTPTGPDRSEAGQAATVEAMVRAVHDYRGNYNVTAYELFDLRDAHSVNPDPFHQLGILKDDYSPKLAFEVYRRLVAELGG